MNHPIDLDQMNELFNTRMKLHTGLVAKYIDKIIALDDPRIDISILVDEKESHDKSKCNWPEKLSFLFSTWKYFLEDQGIEYKPDLSIQLVMLSGTFHHIKNNKHHPEYWDGGVTQDNSINPIDRDKIGNRIVDATDMPLSYVACMVADWMAMDEEKRTDSMSWAKQNINKRWKFSKEQEDFIYDLLDKVKVDKVEKSMTQEKYILLEKSVGYVGNEPSIPQRFIMQRRPGGLVSRELADDLALVRKMQKPVQPVDMNLYQYPVMKIDDIAKNLGLTAEQEEVLSSFLKDLINTSQNDAVLMQGLNQKLRDLNYDPMLRNVIWYKMRQYQKDHLGKSVMVYTVDQLQKTEGEGSRGGHVVGHTSTGKPIYESSIKEDVAHEAKRAFEPKKMSVVPVVSDIGPSGHMSNRARQAHKERSRQALFGPHGLQLPEPKQPDKRERLKNRIKFLENYLKPLPPSKVGPPHVKPAPKFQKELDKLRAELKELEKSEKTFIIQR